jgi:hypothetical protein
MPQPPVPDGAPKAQHERYRLGVVGTLVWDTIHSRDPSRAHPVHEWGGIAYGLGAFEATLPPTWDVVPIVKVGADLAEKAFELLSGLPRVRSDQVLVVPEPNNRVEIRYVDTVRRTERLTGGVSPWDPTPLGAACSTVDALFINFISGFEMTLETAEHVTTSFSGPVYCDLHSLFLDVSQGGFRTPRQLPEWRRWLECFDAVQMNEAEFDLLATRTGDPWALAAELVGRRLRLITVTMGPKGAAYIAAPDFEPDPLAWSHRPPVAGPAPVRSGRVPLAGLPVDGDPTGCGDVWGATLFSCLLGGAMLTDGMTEANRLAQRNVALRGADGLHRHLTGRLSTGKEVR